MANPVHFCLAPTRHRQASGVEPAAATAHNLCRGRLKGSCISIHANNIPSRVSEWTGVRSECSSCSPLGCCIRAMPSPCASATHGARHAPAHKAVSPLRPLVVVQRSPSGSGNRLLVGVGRLSGVPRAQRWKFVSGRAASPPRGHGDGDADCGDERTEMSATRFGRASEFNSSSSARRRSLLAFGHRGANGNKPFGVALARLLAPLSSAAAAERASGALRTNTASAAGQ